jgi:hypothetical protein
MIDRTARLTRATPRLAELSLIARSEDSRRFRWPSAIATDRLAMSEALLPVAGLPVWESLDDERRREIALLEATHFFSLNIAGERELMAGIAQRLYQGHSVHVSRYLQHFLHEENEHTAVFARFCLDYGGRIFRDRQVSFPRQFTKGEEEFLFFARVLVFEEIAFHYNRKIADDPDVWSLARDINRYHADDESRHIAFGRLLLEDMWERFIPIWDAGHKARIVSYLERYIASVLNSYVNPDVHRAAGLPAGTRDQILESAHWKALREESTARTRRWLRKIGASHDV